MMSHFYYIYISFRFISTLKTKKTKVGRHRSGSSHLPELWRSNWATYRLVPIFRIINGFIKSKTGPPISQFFIESTLLLALKKSTYSWKVHELGGPGPPNSQSHT